MAKTRVTLNSPTFIYGSLYPAGTVLDVDLADFGLKSLDDTHTPKPDEGSAPQEVPLAPNFDKATKADQNVPDYEVAAVMPTGPNPTAPQATPPEAQMGVTGGMVMPNADGQGGGAAITPETTDDPAKK